MKQFEYMVEYVYGDVKKSSFYDNETIVEKLNEFGKNGWELVAIRDSVFYFKREVKESKEKN